MGDILGCNVMINHEESKTSTLILVDNNQQTTYLVTFCMPPHIYLGGHYNLPVSFRTSDRPTLCLGPRFIDVYSGGIQFEFSMKRLLDISLELSPETILNEMPMYVFIAKLSNIQQFPSARLVVCSRIRVKVNKVPAI